MRVPTTSLMRGFGCVASRKTPAKQLSNACRYEACGEDRVHSVALSHSPGAIPELGTRHYPQRTSSGSGVRCTAGPRGSEGATPLRRCCPRHRTPAPAPRSAASVAAPLRRSRDGTRQAERRRTLQSLAAPAPSLPLPRLGATASICDRHSRRLPHHTASRLQGHRVRAAASAPLELKRDRAYATAAGSGVATRRSPVTGSK